MRENPQFFSRAFGAIFIRVPLMKSQKFRPSAEFSARKNPPLLAETLKTKGGFLELLATSGFPGDLKFEGGFLDDIP